MENRTVSPAPAAPPGAPTSLFNALAFPPDGYCEAFESPGKPRDHWRSLITALEATGLSVLNHRRERVSRMRHEDGATFNPFDDPSEGGTPWALDMIPLPIPATEWALLETGLIQRAHLLEQILADVYGPQRLLSGGRIPAELIFANPSFLRPCHGIKPAGNRFLAYYAADLYRGPDGRFRVLRDYGANPIGMGYALENRIVLSRVFSEIYHQTQIHRLAPFFHTFHRSLVQRASVRREDPAIVLLSPGPLNRFYFEHALLSRYLNYPLVEYQDLTVRNGEVFLKKLTGLEPVEAIFRHMGDTGSDPFALRQGTETGVSGLIQVSREQDIDIINPIGSGFVDTPALPALLPSLCRHLMGEELALENHPVWWCHIAEHRDFVLSHLDQLTLGPAMDRSSAGPSSEDPRQAIQAMPHAVLAREPIRPATVPAWDETGVHAGYALMRVFVCATQRGFAVMPGGMAVTAGDITTLTGDFPERQRSKDIWVLSDQPVAHFSLMDGLQKPAEFRRSNDLPSRVADHLLWLGRYLERAEGRVRLLRSVLRRLAGEDRLSDIPELPFLLNLLRKQNSIAEAPEGESGLPRYRALTAQLKAALYQRDRTDSVAAVLHRVQVAARHVRDWFSLDAWRAINRLEDFKDSPADDSLELLDDTLFALNAFSGLAMESMTRGLGWRFLDMGRRIERAINLANLVRIGLFQAGTESRNALEALLEVAASIMTYRARYRTTFQLAPVLDLLLIDESNPKSLAFQCSRLAAHVEHLPRQGQRRFASQEERMALEMLTGVRLLDLTPLENRQGDNDFQSLMRFLDFMDRRLKDFAQVISTHYLSRIPATPHYSTILTEAPRV